jgi:hypothetical protein
VPLLTVPGDKVGIALNVRAGKIMPVNGFRYTPENRTTGWYIWAGKELSPEDDFFKSLHIEHVGKWWSYIVKFLALPPGWGFLSDGTYEDVWFDPSLLVEEQTP